MLRYQRIIFFHAADALQYLFCAASLPDFATRFRSVAQNKQAMFST